MLLSKEQIDLIMTFEIAAWMAIAPYKKDGRIITSWVRIGDHELKEIASAAPEMDNQLTWYVKAPDDLYGCPTSHSTSMGLTYLKSHLAELEEQGKTLLEEFTEQIEEYLREGE